MNFGLDAVEHLREERGVVRRQSDVTGKEVGQRALRSTDEHHVGVAFERRPGERRCGTVAAAAARGEPGRAPNLCMEHRENRVDISR